MSEQIYTYRGSSYNPDQAYHYELLILVEAKSFSYAVIYDKHLLAYDGNCALTELNGTGELQDILAADYKKIIVGLPSTGFSLIPAAVFNIERTNEFARLLDIKPNEKVLAQVLDHQNHIIYKTADELILALATVELQNTVFGAKGWIKAIAEYKPANTKLFLNIKSQKIEVLYFKDGALRFYNAFDYQMEDDAIYYTALVARELALQPEATTVVISGDIDFGYQLYTKLSEFFGTVTLNDIVPVALPEELAAHHLLALTALSLCESSAAH